ncbi:MAG: KOW domain-containing RNA-binding protein [Lachnospiraceae bacterium]|nr:KOW domain-containing RNA-binding protein [Lachnospiraceae bacterium]
MTGMLATSRAGHDKNTVYVIIKEEAEYIYLVDGKIRTLDKPKRKNKKHIQIIKKCPDKDMAGQIQSGTVDDIMIRKFIQKYKADNDN